VTPNPSTGKKHFGATQWAFSHLGFDTKTTIYPGVVALVLNVAVAIVLTVLFRAGSLPVGVDSTHEADYHLEAGDPGVTKDLPDPLEGSGSPERVPT
jgi:SSS family solute:Na+ symporter